MKMVMRGSCWKTLRSRDGTVTGYLKMYRVVFHGEERWVTVPPREGEPDPNFRPAGGRAPRPLCTRRK